MDSGMSGDNAQDISSSFNEESEKFILQLDLDADTVQNMLKGLPYRRLHVNSLPSNAKPEIHCRARYISYVQKLQEARANAPAGNECNIEINVVVRHCNPAEVYETEMTVKDPKNEVEQLMAINQALDVESDLGEAVVKCDITLNSVQALTAFYADYKSGLLNKSFSSAILGNQEEEANRGRYNVHVGINERIFFAEKDRLQAYEDKMAAKIVKK